MDYSLLGSFAHGISQARTLRKLLSWRIFMSSGRVAHLNSMETETPALVILLDLALFIFLVPLHLAVYLHPLYCPL